MLFLNTTGSIGQIIMAGTGNLTGSIIATIFFILFFLLAICIMFGIPLEFAMLLLLPFVIVIASAYGNFMLLLIVILALFSWIIAKNFIFR